MIKKSMTLVVEKGKPVVMIAYNNGVHPDKDTHVSGAVAIDRDLYIQACKDRLLFNKIFDGAIDIRQGWQNALGDMIEASKNLSEYIDIDATARAIANADIAARGEDAVKADIEKFDKANKTIEKAAKATKTKKNKKQTDTEEKDGQ